MKNQDYSRFIIGLEHFNQHLPVDIWASFLRGGSDPPKSRSSEPIVGLLAFVLMPNHFHLIIKEKIKGGISLFMKKIGGYSTYFNKQYDRVGSLFQSRYKAVAIKDEQQLYTVFNYVHTNPVELIEPSWKDYRVRNIRRAITWLEHYKWSSHRDYIGKPTFASTTERDFFLNFLGGQQKCRQAVRDWIVFRAKKTDFGPEVIE